MIYQWPRTILFVVCSLINSACNEISGTVPDCSVNSDLLEQLHVVVDFPNPNSTCRWDSNGNLSPRNAHFQGRKEQIHTFNLPNGANICSIEMDFPSQNFQFDDYFLFTFNNYVIASSHDFSDILESEMGVPVYNWNLIAGRPWDISRDGVFCLGKDSFCQWPKPESHGQLKIDIAPSTLKNLMQRLPYQSNHEIKFTSLGDDDFLDCTHSGLQFELIIEYFSN